jgi:transposase-like protein
LRGDRSVEDVCREHEISDTLFYSWREKLLEGGREVLAGKGGGHRRAGAAPDDPRAGARFGSEDL